MKDGASSWQVFGATVRGPAHVDAGLPNQDAWLGEHAGFGSLAVVCDGLGSAPRSRTGSRAGCRAVLEAVHRWAAAEDAAVGLLTRLIHVLWALNVSPDEPRDCATTCLFAAAMTDGRLVVGQLGDGLALVQIPGHSPRVIADEREGFGNETSGLGVTRSVEEWKVHVEHRTLPGTSVLLASDGVADDLEPDTRAAFARHLRDHYGPLPARERRDTLTTDLTAWPTPNHLDDKTVVLLWSESQPPGEVS